MYCRWSSPAGWPSRSSTGWRVPMNEATLDKRLIAESFSRAAPTYDKAAALQRTVGSNLLGRLPRDFVPGDILDLGCGTGHLDRKSTRLNSSHVRISYAVFCLKKKKKHKNYDVSC